MICREFAHRLNEVLDERGNPRSDRAIAAHASDCPPCDELLADHELVLATVVHLPNISPPSGFARRVVAQAAAQHQPMRKVPASRTWLAISTLLAAAAAMLLAVSLVWYVRQGEPIAVDQNQIDRDQGPAIVGQESPRSPVVSGGTRGGSLALGQSNWIVNAPRLPSELRRNYRGTLDNLAISLPQTVQRLDEVERYAPGIKPLRVSFRVVMEALWRAMPGGEDEPATKSRTTHWGLEPHALA